MAREGWLQQPASRQTKRFRRDSASWSLDPCVFVDSGLHHAVAKTRWRTPEHASLTNSKLGSYSKPRPSVSPDVCSIVSWGNVSS